VEAEEAKSEEGKKMTRPRGRGVRPVIGKSVRTGDEVRLCGGIAIEDAGFNQASIWRCCNGQRKSHAGFTWRYEDGGTSTRRAGYLRHNKNARPVIGTCKETGEQMRLAGGKDIVAAGFSQCGVWKAAHGIIKHHHGWLWEFEDEKLAREEHNLMAALKVG
jgi:hypothetical protein